MLGFIFPNIFKIFDLITTHFNDYEDMLVAVRGSLLSCGSCKVVTAVE